MTPPGTGRAPGRDAATPSRIPARGWRLVLRRVGGRVMADRFPVLSAGIAFFAVLSVAPVLLTALSVYGAINTPEQALRQLSQVSRMLPAALEELVADQLTNITAVSTQVLTLQGLTALLVALWTATVAMANLIDALDVAYDEKETRSIGRRIGLSLVFVLGSALLLGAVLYLAGVVARAVADAPGAVRVLAQVLAWPALAALMVVSLGVLYRFAPDRKEAQWRWISWGAVGTTALWLAASVGLFAYVRGPATYETTYGSLAGVAISMFWLWVTVLLVILGAAVNAEAERQTERDSTVGPEQPLGQRGAVVADSVAGKPRE